MEDGISSGFKWNLTRDTACDVWELQFQVYLSTKGSLRRLTEAPLPDMPEQIAADAVAKAQMILAMTDASLIAYQCQPQAGRRIGTLLCWMFRGAFASASTRL